jgi:hypothetical protein
MGTLTLAFPVEPSKERDALYRSALADLGDGAVLAAVVEIVQTDHFFPKVARIREIVARNTQSEYRAQLMAPTPSERIFGELAGAWNRGDGIDGLSGETRRIAEHLDWDARETLTLPDVIRAYNETHDAVLTSGAAR